MDIILRTATISTHFRRSKAGHQQTNLFLQKLLFGAFAPTPHHRPCRWFSLEIKEKKYRFTAKQNFIDLYLSEDDETTWKKTNLRSVTAALNKSYICGRNSVQGIRLRRSNKWYYSAILLAVLISLLFVYVLKNILNTKITDVMILEALLFYVVILIAPTLIIPPFIEMFDEMELALPPITAFYFMIASNSMGIFEVYTCIFNHVSSCSPSNQSGNTDFFRKTRAQARLIFPY